jgi:hypothetical protein
MSLYPLFILIMKKKFITTSIVSLNPGHGNVYSIQHYVIKFVSALITTTTCLLKLSEVTPMY